jgi:hypothetical protein
VSDNLQTHHNVFDKGRALQSLIAYFLLESYMKDVCVGLWIHRIGHWLFSDFDRKSNYSYAHRSMILHHL